MKNQLHSVVVPVYQSRKIIESLVNGVSRVLEKESISFEIILVDDGSQDGSFEEIKRLSKIHKTVFGFRLSRNFGQQAALMVGLEKARGEWIAVIDDDLQDPPELLPRFFSIVRDECDVAYGVRKARKEGIVKNFLYFMFYRILNQLSAIKIPLDAGDFCAMKRMVRDAMLQLSSAHPFLRGNRAWVGFRQLGIPYERAERAGNQSGYTLKKYIEFALTGILSFSYIPLRLITYCGLVCTFFSVLFVCYNIIGRLFHLFNVPGYTSLISFIVFFGSIQLISIGILGEYVARLFDETKRWPTAFVAETTLESV